MSESTNSLQKLHNIFSKAPRKQEFDFVKFWSDVFEVNPNLKEVIEKYKQLIILLQDAKEEVLQLEEKHINIIEPQILTLETTLLKRWSQINFANFSSYIKPEIIDSLFVYSEILNLKGHGHKIISKDKIEQLLADVNYLIDEFMTSDLPSELKLDLIQQLKKIHDALTHFHITGEVQLQRVTNQVVGDILAKSVQKPSLFKKFLDSDIVKVINLAAAIITLNSQYNHTAHNPQASLQTAIITSIKNLPDEPDNTLPRLNVNYDPQEMSATIDNEANYKLIPACQEEE